MLIDKFLGREKADQAAAFCAAAEGGDIATMKRLRDQGANVNARYEVNSAGRRGRSATTRRGTALTLAVSAGQLEAVRFLLADKNIKLGAARMKVTNRGGLNGRQTRQEGLLRVAIHGKSEEIALLLLENNVPPESKLFPFETELRAAKIAGQEKVADALLAKYPKLQIALAEFMNGPDGKRMLHNNAIRNRSTPSPR